MPYYIMFGKFEDSWDTDIREMYKDIFMKCYFGKSTEKIINAFKYINGFFHFDIEDSMDSLKDSVDKFCGRTFDTAAFLYESCIYIDVYRKLLASGIRSCVVYDAFYLPKGTDSKSIDFEIQSCAEEFYKRSRNNFI